MSSLQIQLNGSNIINEKRKQAFMDALNDKHIVEFNGGRLKDSNGKGEIPHTTDQQSSQINNNHSAPNPGTNGEEKHHSSELVNSIELGLNHSYDHQTRTMEIHQQYLSQQQEYTQLITTVLNEQGKVLERSNGNIAEGIIDTFQQSLDNIHEIRGKGMEVHQQFLEQQAAYSESYVRLLENQHQLLQNGRNQAIYTDEPLIQAELIETTDLAEPAGDDNLPIQQSKDDIKQEKIVIESKSGDQRGDNLISSAVLSAALLKIVGEKTGYPPEMLELDMDLEADLGIDSIKRVEILGALEDEFPSLPPADTEVLAQTRTLLEIVEYLNKEAGQISENGTSVDEKISLEPNRDEEDQPPQIDAQQLQSQSSSINDHSVEELTAILLEIVAEKTGYPVEMLEPEMDMEADLGIDSIKRVEILGAMEDQVEGLPAVEAETLAELRTLKQIVEIMSSKNTAPKNPPAAEEVAKKKVGHSTLEVTPIKLISLPEPDRLEFKVSQNRPIVVTDEGTELTSMFVTALSQEGWNVVLWQFPETLIPTIKRDFPQEVMRVQQEENSLDSIKPLIDKIRDQQGLISGFIHLHPLQESKEAFPRTERDLVKQIFFLAGEIKADITTINPGGRSLFLTVTRIDGQLGLKNHHSFQESSGFSGLVKTLHWEWPEVFCRAVDIDPELTQSDQIASLLSEIQDLDLSLVEVGLGSQDRVTIRREYQE
jgi:acyl carrier protein